MLIMTFQAVVPMSEAQDPKERIAMCLEEFGCRDIRCIEVHEDVEQMRMEANA